MSKLKRLYLATVFLLIFHSVSFADSNLATKISTSAKAEIGKGEEIRNNCGKDIRRYLRGRENLSWCAGFVSYVLFESGVKDFGYCLSAREFFNKAKVLGRITEIPEAGDLIVFYRGNRNSWQGHVGIVEKVTDKEIITIEGNVGKFPAKVKRMIYQRNNIKRLLGFVMVR